MDSKENTKKLRNKSADRSITCIENLSNELIYGIFDYLNGHEILTGFSNLNHRFQQLLHSSSLLLKFHFCETIDKELIDKYKHQIFSFDLQVSPRNDYFFSTFSIDSSFDRLESLSIINIDSNILKLLFSSLPNVPRLLSLSIDTHNRWIDHNDIYRLIFSLPALKYAKCLLDDSGQPLQLQMATDEQMNSLESLIIAYPCTYNDLFIILSYTPELCYLKFEHFSMDDSMDELIIPTTLSNLTHISMCVDYMRFDELEIFISHLDCDLQVFRMKTSCGDTDYFNDDRWEELICDYMPYLEEFYFEYRDELDHESDYRTYFNSSDRFTSEFWIENQWVLEAEMDSFEIVYSIRRYKKRWYDIINSSIELSQPTRLILTHIPDDDDQIMFTMHMRDLLAVTRIYHLEIPKKEIYFGELIDIIYVLPDLISLKINSLALSLPPYSSMEEKTLRCLMKKNQITKIYLEKINNIREIYFFIKLCSRLNYLQVNAINYVTMESYVRDILNNINQEHHQYLRSLCFHVQPADDQMIKNLAKMIDDEKLLDDYTMKRVCDNIYLQWK